MALPVALFPAELTFEQGKIQFYVIAPDDGTAKGFAHALCYAMIADYDRAPLVVDAVATHLPGDVIYTHVIASDADRASYVDWAIHVAGADAVYEVCDVRQLTINVSNWIFMPFAYKAPADTTPADTAPAGTAPADTAPADTTPASMASADTDVTFITFGSTTTKVPGAVTNSPYVVKNIWFPNKHAASFTRLFNDSVLSAD